MNRDRLDRWIYRGLLLLLLWAPLPFGSVEAWSRAILQIGAFLLLLLWSIQIARGRAGKLARGYDESLNRSPLPLFLIGGVLFGLVQILPINGAAISLDPYSTKSTIMMVVSLTVLFVLALNHFDEQRLKRLNHILIIWGGAISLFAVVQSFAGNGRIYWFKTLSYGGHFFGPYVNRNHYAGFIEMLAPLPIAMLMFGAVSRRLWLIYGFLGALMSLSIVLSASRAGLVSLGGEFIFLSLFMLFGLGKGARRRTERRVGIGMLAMILLAVIIGVASFGADTLMARLNDPTIEVNNSEPIGRTSIWRNSLKMTRDHLFTGVGMGAFDTAYTQYDEADGSYRVEFVHNDYLQLLTDLGIVGAILGGGFLMIFLLRAFRNLRDLNRYTIITAGSREKSQRARRAQLLGALTGCIGLLIHSLFDFNLQIPANALLFLIMVAISSEQV